MDEEIIEEFNERFETIEDALKYTADLQAKSEYIHKRDFIELRKTLAKTNETLDRIAERQNQMDLRQDRMDLRAEQTQKHLNHITKVVRHLADENEFQDEKLDEAGKVLSRKRRK